MSINHEVKGNLARLLATEDLVVEHRKVSTACFNVHTRVLTLPIWDKASGGVYDLLVGHEVGHALYTPTEEWGEVESVPKSFVNITEDARIEKLMKRRYAGLNRTFYSGYNELYDDDFFSIADTDLNKYNLADRINLQCKIGNFTDIPFDDEEREILNIVNDAETFEESVYAAKLIYKHCKDEMKNLTSVNGHTEVLKSGQGDDTKQVEGIPSEGTDGTGGGHPNTGQETDKKSSDSDKVNPDEKSNKQTGGHTDDKLKEPEILTSQNLENAIKNLNDAESEEISYVEIPKIDLKKLIVSPEKVHSVINEHNNYAISNDSYAAEYYAKIDSAYVKFKKNIQKEVNYLVKEFECKKAADSYARASTSRTGVLDTRRIHTYKYSDDLFKKVTTFADGKSHGLIFILDWSGSMDKVMLNTVKQLFNIIWFCKRVGIPFDVYAFTEEYYEIDPVGSYRLPKTNSYKKAENLLNIGPDLNLLNLISSKCNLQTLETHMKNVYRMAHEFNNTSYSNRYFTPSQLSLSGTPLNECLACLHELIPEFNKKNRVQKLHCIVLTDGEANSSTYHKEFERTSPDGTPIRYFGVNYFGINSVLRIRKTGRTYSVNKNSLGLGSSAGVTKCIIDSLRGSYPETSFIGIRLLSAGDCAHFYRNYFEYGEAQDAAREEWKHEKSITIVDRAGYHKYFGIPANSLSNSSTMVISPYATEISKTTLTSAFKNSLNAKKMNKKFLNELVELIA